MKLGHPPTCLDPVTPSFWHSFSYLRDVTCVWNEFLRPLVMPDLRRFDFSLKKELNIVLTLTELAVIVKGLSRRSLVSELSYIGQDGFTEATGALPFTKSLKAPQTVLSPSIMRIVAEKIYLLKLTSLSSGHVWRYGRFYRHVGDTLG